MKENRFVFSVHTVAPPRQLLLNIKKNHPLLLVYVTFACVGGGAWSVSVPVQRWPGFLLPDTTSFIPCWGHCFEVSLPMEPINRLHRVCSRVPRGDLPPHSSRPSSSAASTPSDQRRASLGLPRQPCRSLGCLVVGRPVGRSLRSVSAWSGPSTTLTCPCARCSAFCLITNHQSINSGGHAGSEGVGMGGGVVFEVVVVNI